MIWRLCGTLALLIAVGLLVSLSSVANAGQAALTWDANTQPAVAGYMLQYGTASGTYTAKIDVGKVTQYTVPGLLEGTRYYFAATDYDLGRAESGFSNEVNAIVPYSTPVANFTANTTSGVATLSISFTSTSSGSISGYSWNFGDSTTSTSANPTHSYGAAGTYNVGLTVSGPGGTNTMTKASYITVSTASSIAPVANFTANSTSGAAPLAVAFTSKSTGSISAYSWNFGDGTTNTTANPSHAYGIAGTYTVNLTVTGPGGSNKMTKTNFVTVSSTPPPSLGLVAAYGFDEGTGTSVSDRSGKGNNGVISGATWAATGRFGKALSFNGTNSWVTVADSASLDLMNGMTLEAWIYPTATMTGWRTVMMKEQPSADIYYLSANTDINQPATGVSVGGTIRQLDAGTTIPVNAWTHLTATYDGTTQRLYINGVQVASGAQTGSITTSISPLHIGGNSIWGEYFNGYIDEVRIYNRALTTSEIQADMNKAVGP